MNRRSFFSFLSAAPVGLPMALAGMSSANGFIGDELHHWRVSKLDPRFVWFKAIPGEMVDVRVRGSAPSSAQVRALFDAINDGMRDGHRFLSDGGRWPS